MIPSHGGYSLWGFCSASINFYLAAFIEGIDKQECFDNPEDKSPTIYRVDKIEKLKVTAEHFSVPYKDRFQEGEMRKRIQFMYGGELQRIRFAYTGPSIEAVLDRLPTAKIEKQTENGWICTAEVFGWGFELWANGQGEYIKIEKSSSIRNGRKCIKMKLLISYNPYLMDIHFKIDGKCADKRPGHSICAGTGCKHGFTQLLTGKVLHLSCRKL